MKQALERFFRITEQGSSVRTEVIAGITTFLTMMYIVPLNGIIMGASGMPVEAVITATALITVIATVFNGVWSNTPIAMSVGLGLNSYFAFALVKGQNIPWQTVLGIVFLSGVFFMVLTLTSVRKMIIESISPEFRISVSAGIGLFIAFIGLKEMGVIASNPVTFVTLGDLSKPEVLLGLACLFLITALVVWKVRGAFIISILVMTVVAFVTGLTKAPSELISMPASISPIFLEMDIKAALSPAMIAPIITFMLTDLFDSLGTLAGVGYRAGIFSDRDSRAIQKTLEADAGATVVGSLLGVSTTTSFIESASGVEEGGRTGLCAVVTGILFMFTLFLLPFFKSIPPNAIFPVLVIVGVFMFADLKNIDFGKFEIGIPAFLIIILMPLTYSITKGLAAGFISYVFIMTIRGRARELNAVMIILAAISVLAFIIG